MRRLKDWLGKTAAPKFIISPSMLLPRHRRAIQRDARLDPANLSALHSDGWDGYPNTLREVLGYIAAKSIPNVVFLSGDEHRGCIAAARLFDEAGRLLTTVHSIHTAAMYAPYPFANGIDEEIVASETIAFTHDGRDYRCVVEATRPPEGDGATFFRVYQDGADWQLDCEFADGVTRTVTL